MHDIRPILKIYGVAIEWRHIPPRLRRRYGRARAKGPAQALSKVADDIFIEEILRRAGAIA